MASQMRMYCILGMTVYMGFILLLSVGSKNSAAAVFQVTELTPGVETPYDARPINAFYFTNTAIKHPNLCHSGERRNPAKYWMPDQVRHDAVGVFGSQSNKALLDQEYFVNVFSMTNVCPEIGFADADITKAPVPTIAFLFPFALILLLTQSRRLVDKMYDYFAFPVF